MEDLFKKNISFQDDLFRNIVSLRVSQDLYDDINDGDDHLSTIATLVEFDVKKDIPSGLINRDFHYTTAISYPFETDSFMESRYSDGKFGVWYGSLDLNTSIFETAYHMIKEESVIIGNNEAVVRERAVYKIYCEAILLDLRGRELDYPKLISEKYDFIQQIGRKLHREGHPGLLAPSARCEGANAIIFNPSILNNPRNHCYLTYTFNPKENTVIVERTSGKALFVLTKQQCTRHFSDAGVLNS